MVAAKGSKEIGDKINKIIGRLADANDSLKGAINVADFNDEEKLGKADAMVQRLTKLVAIFEGLDFGGNRAEGDDLLGDAYEYLMRHFATESGKSKGQFYTPAEVSASCPWSSILGKRQPCRAEHLRPHLRLRLAAAESPRRSQEPHRAGPGALRAGDGQRHLGAGAMNMVLHDCPTAEIWQDNTLSHPHFKQADGSLKTFDFVVANFPFSVKSWTSGLDPANDLYGRFDFGIPPPRTATTPSCCTSSPRSRAPARAR
jgi:type I restriction enzyme M protein